MTPEEKAEIRAYCAAATPGPENVSCDCIGRCGDLPAVLDALDEAERRIAELGRYAYGPKPFALGVPAIASYGNSPEKAWAWIVALERIAELERERDEAREKLASLTGEKK